MGKQTKVVFEILDKGEIIRNQFHDSLHAFSDEASRAGIKFPHGLFYLGPVSKGLLKPVDEKHLEAVYDPGLISFSEVEKFLDELKIKCRVENQ